MKKLAVVFAAMLAVAFVAPAFAADNLSLSGEFRVRGWDLTDGSATGYAEDSDASYFDQRMRVQAKIKASDNAYVVIRSDFAEGTWGRDFGDDFTAGGWNRPVAGTNTQFQVDRAYGYYGQDNWGVTMGLQYFGVGILEVIDGQYTAMKLDLKYDPAKITLFYGKLDEGASTSDDNAGAVINEDSDLYALNAAFKVGGFDAAVFAAYADLDAGTHFAGALTIEDAWAVGFNVSGKVGMVNLVSELAFLGGDFVQDVSTDLEGLQFYLKGDADVSDAINVGAEFLWAAGDDQDVQLANFSDAGDFLIADTNAPSATDVCFSNNGPFDFTGDGAGVLGATLFASYKAMDKLTIGGKFAYFTPEEDDATAVDSVASYSIWAGYDLGSNTSLVLLYNIADWDSDVTADDGAAKTLYARFLINF